MAILDMGCVRCQECVLVMPDRGYPEPKPAAQHIKGYVAFEKGKGMELEK